jgi:hypothetical protein
LCSIKSPLVVFCFYGAIHYNGKASFYHIGMKQ